LLDDSDYVNATNLNPFQEELSDEVAWLGQQVGTVVAQTVLIGSNSFAASSGVNAVVCRQSANGTLTITATGINGNSIAIVSNERSENVSFYGTIIPPGVAKVFYAYATLSFVLMPMGEKPKLTTYTDELGHGINGDYYDQTVWSTFITETGATYNIVGLAGRKLRVINEANSGGITVRYNNVIKVIISAGDWADLECDGSTWFPVASGSFSSPT